VGFFSYEVLLLVHDSTPVAVDTLEPSNLVVMDIPVEVEESLAGEDTLAVVHIPVVDRLAEAFAIQQCQFVVVRVDHGLPHSYLLVVARSKVFLLVASQVVILLQVVRLVVPDRS
jgi:hypothetical protein